MKLVRLHLQAHGPFTDRILDFDSNAQSLALVHGDNEAGKSSALRGIIDLCFGIPAQSPDNFVHAHPDMRIGGVFLDRHGRQHAVVRRKGRGATLLLAEPASVPVPRELELLITGGLSREDYEATYGLDHERLRAGGKALLEGQGDVGAALFEASAGVRSIPAVIEHLDQSARKFFMPGARGKNARINEALRIYKERHETFRQAIVRAPQWGDLLKKHDLAAEEVARLNARRRELVARQLLIAELRAVAPLLRTLDGAAATLQELETVRLLSPTAATERASAEAGLAAAEHSAGVAAADSAQHRARLEALVLDTAVLELGSLIEPLAASVDLIERHRKELSDTGVEVGNETARLALLAARIDPTAQPDAVVRRAPGPAARAGMEEALLTVERAAQALAQHRESMTRQHTAVPETTPPPMPSTESRTALRSARREVERASEMLERLAALPAAIKSAERKRAASLAALGLADEAALRRLRPLLDSEIDAAQSQRERNSTRRREFEKRIADMSAALNAEVEGRERLLAGGVVPTRDEVDRARERRDTGWALVRATYVERSNPPIAAFTAGEALPDAYEAAVRQADALVDELARDTARAAELQSHLREIAKLETHREHLAGERAQLERDEREQQTAWEDKLRDARLPPVAPHALREWQVLLEPARMACENLQAMLDGQAQDQASERILAASLRQAILGMESMGAPSADASLSTLSAMAVEIESELTQREMNANTAAGQQQAREHQRKQAVAREAELLREFETARDALTPGMARLLLHESDAPAVARARLGEFDALLAAREKLEAATARQRNAGEALARIERRVAGIAEMLGEPPPADLRLGIDGLSARLKQARAVENERTLTARALAVALETQRSHEETAGKHAGALKNLCAAADASSPARLPEAEDRSRRKREAQAAVDQCKTQLAQASPRAITDLRALLQDQEAARMYADEAEVTQALASLEEQLGGARAHEEAARRALEAIDSADTAARSREDMERAAATVRANLRPWMRSRLAHALLTETLRRFRDRAQGPMLLAASAYFERMTAGEFVRLVSDDNDNRPVLMAQRRNGAHIGVNAMSEGTRDQLYLALRLAALAIRRGTGIELPVILDDVLVTSDDQRAGLTLQALAEFSTGNQVIVFTHHRHLIEVARRHVGEETLAVVSL